MDVTRPDENIRGLANADTSIAKSIQIHSARVFLSNAVGYLDNIHLFKRPAGTDDARLEVSELVVIQMT